jgi:RimJ/RimL family protein N-acetyltransferase
VLVEVDGVVVGVSAISMIEGDLKDGKRLLNVGVMLEEGVRGRGVGKAVTGCLVEIAWMMGRRVGVKTMKANAGMRGVMKRLGVEERIEDVMMEGRGLVAEIVYIVEQEKWEKLGVCLEFGDEV